MDFNIITFHNALNHGAVLQAYALQSYIEQIGYSAGIYDYRPSTANRYSGVKGKLFKLLRFLDKSEYQEKEKKFYSFVQNNLKLNVDETPKVFLTGSDQVWNTGSGMNPMYFLCFLKGNVIKASYAASMASSKISSDNINKVKKYLNSFDFISVRENGVKDSLREITDQDINVNIDPTFLLKKSEWRAIEKRVANIPPNYILVYLMHFSRNVNQLLKWLKKETGADIIVIDGQGIVQGKLSMMIYHDKALHNIGPEEFLWLIDHAQSVVTSSFHGTAFSIIFEKEFYSIVNPMAPSRLVNLLSIYNLPMVSESATYFSRHDNIDWGEVEKISSSERARAKQYLDYLIHFRKKEKHKSGNISKMEDMCSGCAACESVCPTQAISIALNQEGFYRPQIDFEKCINCSKCINTCPIENYFGFTRKKAYYGWYKDEKVLYDSSSGGAFYALAQKIIKEGNGNVYGAVFTSDYQEVVFANTDLVPLKQLQKSKYTVSNPSGIYKKIENELKSGRKILFCGAPCQVAGLLSYLGTEYTNLWTCDFVCGGMASLSFFKEHINKIMSDSNAQIESIDFRPKDKGWGKHHISVQLTNGKRFFSREYKDTYFMCFVDEHISVSKYCLSCEFHSLHRADITLADFWGYKKAGVKVNKKGTSMLVANTPKGEAAINELDNFVLYEMDMGNSDYAFGSSCPSQKKLEEHRIFFDKSNKVGFEKAAIEIYGIGTFNQLRRWIKTRVRR